MPNLSEKEVKEFLKQNEKKFTLKLNTCMILLKDTEYVVKTTTTSRKIFISCTNPVTLLYMLMTRMMKMRKKK